MTGLAEQQRLAERYLVPTYARQPVAFARGAGARLWDEDGVEYLDFLSGIAVVNAGHCHPRVQVAVAEQSARLLHVSNLFYTEPQLRLARALAERSLGGKVFFCNSGAEANEAALKLARKARPGGEIVSVHDGFHGRTYGALSATPQEAKQQPFAPLVPGFRAVPPTPEALAAAISGRTAAVLLEVVQGESGIHPLREDALRAARAACDATGALLIFDEVQTGLGRTGTLWGWQQVGVRPDAMTLAKALAGGLPMGALVTSPAYGDVLEPGDHGSTFAGGPVAARAALAVLEVLDDPTLMARVRALGERLVGALAELPGVAAVRGRGLMVAFDLAAGAGAPALVRRALLEQRLVLNATGPATVRLLPPLIVSDAEVGEALARLRRLLA
jgi:acetylornithine/N-succinyldiaminopimelate aminotransferase